MRRVSSSFSIALVAVAAPPLGGSALALAQAKAHAAQIVAHTVELSQHQGKLGLELSDGSKVRITLSRGNLLINDRVVGHYPAAHSALENSWIMLLGDAASLSTPDLKTR